MNVVTVTVPDGQRATVDFAGDDDEPMDITDQLGKLASVGLRYGHPDDQTADDERATFATVHLPDGLDVSLYAGWPVSDEQFSSWLRAGVRTLITWDLDRRDPESPANGDVAATQLDT